MSTGCDHPLFELESNKKGFLTGNLVCSVCRAVWSREEAKKIGFRLA